MTKADRPILCVDFDGVIHSYTSGWKGADSIPDPPVKGALAFIAEATKYFRVAIFSSRSNQPNGREAMQNWLYNMAINDPKLGHEVLDEPSWFNAIEWPTEKPPAFLTIDDRAICFEGDWFALDPKALREFQPWNKRPFGARGTFSQGQLNDDDQGDLQLGIAYDKLDGIVRVEFGKPVAWLGLPPPQAIEFARLLLKSAGVKTVETEP